MSLERQLGFWLLLLAGLVGFILVLHDVMLPFVAGLILAYLLDPVVDRLQRLGLGRLVGTLLVLGVFIALFVLALVLAIPLLANQFSAFVVKLPVYAVRLQTLVVEQGGPLIERIGGPERLKELESSLGDVVAQGANWIGGLFRSIWSGGRALLGVFSLLVVTPVVAFYLILDYDRMVSTIDSWLPRRHRRVIRRLAGEMNASVAGFLRGQALICLLLGSFYAIGLSLIGLNFGFLIGFIAGIINFIPFLGSLTGLLLSGGVAVAQFWPDAGPIAGVIGIFALGQFIEGNILQPRLLGASVGLHPVWLMFALFAFGSTLGFVGVMLAVPLAAIIGVLARFALGQYLKSPLHHGRPTHAAGEQDAARETAGR